MQQTLLPLLGIVIAAIYAFVIQPQQIARLSPRLNALVRIPITIGWFLAGSITALIAGILWVLNWLIWQLLLGEKGWDITKQVTDWWLDWTRTCVYGSP